jgi:hypothetical protein
LHQPQGSRKGLNWIEKKKKNTVYMKKKAEMETHAQEVQGR